MEALGVPLVIRLVCSKAPSGEPITLALDVWVIERFSDNAPASGNASKLKIAVAMLKVVRKEVRDRALRLVADCWYMNRTLMQPALQMGIEVIAKGRPGQIPSNRTLYVLPTLPAVKKPGRPRKYGTRMTAEKVEKLPEHKAVENTSALDALGNGRLCIITAVDRLQKSVMSEDFPDTLEIPRYNNRRHDENL